MQFGNKMNKFFESKRKVAAMLTLHTLRTIQIEQQLQTISRDNNDFKQSAKDGNSKIPLQKT